jgi:hypothetical protein
MKTLLNTIMAMVVTAAPAFAAAGNSTSHSGIFVWIFLGFCALIVVAQLVPALLLLAGMVKGVVTKGEEEEKAHTP